jgi:hypothetical protein
MTDEDSRRKELEERRNIEDQLLHSRTTIFLATNGLWMAVVVGVSKQLAMQLIIAFLGMIVSGLWCLVGHSSWKVMRALTTTMKKIPQSDDSPEKVVQKAIPHEPGKFRPTNILALWLPSLFFLGWLLMFMWGIWVFLRPQESPQEEGGRSSIVLSLAAGASMMDILKVLIGAVAGYLLGWLQDRRNRIRRAKAHWSALEAEITMCGNQALKFLGQLQKDEEFMQPLAKDTRRKKTPDFRCPIVSFRSSLPALLADGGVSEGDIEPLTEFYGRVETLNRGLDNAATMRVASPGGLSEIPDQVDCNLRCAMALVSQGTLAELELKKEGTCLSPTMRDHWKKWSESPTLYDEAMQIVQLL